MRMSFAYASGSDNDYQGTSLDCPIHSGQSPPETKYHAQKPIMKASEHQAMIVVVRVAIFWT